jgi:hypothetical protein
MARSQIAQVRYHLRDAINQIPIGRINEVRIDLMKVIGLSTKYQLWYYISGRSQPNLAQAKAVEEYFKTKWNIVEVWKELPAKEPKEV